MAFFNQKSQDQKLDELTPDSDKSGSILADAADEALHEANDQKHQFKDIDEIVSREFNPLITAATINPTPDARQHLVLTLMKDKLFARFPAVHNNRQGAEAFVDDVVGIGIIPEILRKYPDTTDISYNGRFLTVETSSRKFIYARSGKKDDGLDGKKLQIIDDDYINRLIYRFGIRENVEFSESNPIFNGFSDNIRISANHAVISTTGTTMSLRVSRPKLALNSSNFANFAPLQVKWLLDKLVKAHTNILISGSTGTGKTELLKLLVGSIPFRNKIIMIEDVAETHLTDLYPDKDVFNWITKVHRGKQPGQGSTGVGISDLVKQALRNFPQWLMVSETRGSEAYEMFQGVLSGHSIITTLHARSNRAVPSRFIGMCSMGYDLDREQTRDDFLDSMGIGIHITRKIFSNGKILRYLDEIVAFDKDAKDGIIPLFQQYVEERPAEVKENPDDIDIFSHVKFYGLEKTTFVHDIHLQVNTPVKEINTVWEPTSEKSPNYDSSDGFQVRQVKL